MAQNIPDPHVDDDLKAKGRWITVMVFIVLAFLLLRLMHMQIFKGSYFEGLSRNNRIRIVSIKAPRGKIIDRNGIVLADNRPAYNVRLLPEDIEDADLIAERLAEILDVDVAEIARAIEKARPRPYDLAILAKDITFDEMARLESEIFNLPGVSIEATTERDYVYKELASHVLGFLGEVSRKEINAAEDGVYASGDLIGKSGVEESFEAMMRGEKGTRIFEVDARGRKVRVLDEVAPIPGREVRLSLDKRLQEIAKGALGDRAGAVVVMNVNTGEVLTMVSSPSFDPNMYLTPIAPDTWKQIINDPRYPLEHRALRGQYPPGSIFKIFMALAALENEIITPEDTIVCGGSYSMGDHKYGCWKRSGHGEVDLIKSMAESCDVYYYKLGEEMGIDMISEFAMRFGFGRKTGISLNDEQKGIMPSREWKMERYKRSWVPGETINVSIGQGFMLVTPLQMTRAVAAAVNGGKLYTPLIMADSQPNLEKELDISDANLEVVKDSMRAVIEGKYGTGRGIRNPMFAIGGKSGTAQVTKNMIAKLPDASDIPYKKRDHAWFTAFSPVEAPEIVVTAVVEHGGHGGAIAAPIVSDVIKGYYFLKGMEGVQSDN